MIDLWQMQKHTGMLLILIQGMRIRSRWILKRQSRTVIFKIRFLNVVEEKNEGKKTVQKKMFPAYVLINMIMNDDTWYVVRNTRGVTGFVGPGSKPVPLTDEEMASMGLKVDAPNVPFNIGDPVVVKSGVWEDTTGIVRQIDHQNRTVTINIDMFGRETPVEISFNDVEAV